MPRFSPDRMRAAADVVGYEYGTFQDAAFIAMAANTTGAGAIRNVALESVVLHLRILIDFFYVEDAKAKSEYILAEHFFDDPSVWRSHRSRADELVWSASGEAE